MTILVTGAAGLIGSELCRQLTNQGHKIIALDNMSRSDKVPDCHEFYCRDVRDSMGYFKSIQESIEFIFLAKITTQEFPSHIIEVLFYW